MPHIEPVECADIRDPELRQLIWQCESLGVPDGLFAGILARAPRHAKALLRAMVFSHAEGSVDHKLKEIIRIQLARIAGDPYFARLRSAKARAAGLDEQTLDAASGNYEQDPRFSEAEKWALRYAQRMYLAPTEVDAAFYTGLKQHFTEAQIMELGAFIALHYGMQVFMRTLEASSLREPEANL